MTCCVHFRSYFLLYIYDVCNRLSTDSFPDLCSLLRLRVAIFSHDVLLLCLLSLILHLTVAILSGTIGLAVLVLLLLVTTLLVLFLPLPLPRLLYMLLFEHFPLFILLVRVVILLIKLLATTTGTA